MLGRGKKTRQTLQSKTEGNKASKTIKPSLLLHGALCYLQSWQQMKQSMEHNNSNSFLSTCHIPGVMLGYIHTSSTTDNVSYSGQLTTIGTEQRRHGVAYTSWCQALGARSSLQEPSYYIFNTILQTSDYCSHYVDHATVLSLTQLLS